MNRARSNKSFKIVKRHFGSNIFRKSVKIKEEILLTRLGGRLGKSKEDVQKLLSKDLMKLLTLVPSTRYHSSLN
jgi:hypothetical protein